VDLTEVMSNSSRTRKQWAKAQIVRKGNAFTLVRVATLTRC